MEVGIYYNANYINENRAKIQKITRACEINGLECRIVNSPDDVKGLDVLFVLGGDGTILNVASECAKCGTKIIGLNYGHLGFLAEFEPERIVEVVNLVLSGKYGLKRLTMLEVEYEEKRYRALNDFVIQRSTGGRDFSNTISLKAAIDGSDVDGYLADGIIVSTPTGSTAYSLSAGGSILSPDINAFIMTPICAHSLHARPVVYNADSTLKITSAKDNSPLNIIVDGKVVDVVERSTEFTVKKSDKQVEFITRGENDFYKKLSIKLNIWSK